MSPAGVATLIKIIEAGIEVFAQEGPLAGNTLEIAQKAGVAESTIFRRFETKDALIEECLRAIAHRTLDPAQFEALLAKDAEPGEPQFTSSITAAVKRWYARLPVAAARLVLYTSLSRNAKWRSLGSDRTNRIISILAARIEQEARNRRVRKPDAHAAATTLIAGLLYVKSVHPAKERDSAAVESIVNQWIHGLFRE